MMAHNCRNCRFSSKASEDAKGVDGFCRFDPPVLRFLDGDRLNSSFPPVNLDHFRCGKWLRHPFWFNWFGW